MEFKRIAATAADIALIAGRSLWASQAQSPETIEER
jgi:hypothetical protein